MPSTFERFGRVYEVLGEVRAPAGGGSATRRFSPQGLGERLRLDPDAARSLLGGSLGDREPRGELRRLLGARLSCEVVSRMSDGEVIDQIARRIGAGELRVYGMRALRRGYSFKAPDAVDEAVGPDEVGQEELVVASIDAEAAPEELEPTVDVDAAAQAATLRSAAQDGVPFCEECEKAKQAREDSRAHPAPGGA
jgi:hypothetical protein